MLRSRRRGCRETVDLPVLGPIANGNRRDRRRDHARYDADEIITAEVACLARRDRRRRQRAASSPSRSGAREIGHLHGDRVAHFGFPKAVWQELYDAGRIDYHSVFPGKKGCGARDDRDRGRRART